MIFGIGIDHIEVERVNKSINRLDGFLDKVFTAKEQELCESRKTKDQCYAARFAAKEALMKALGTGWQNGVMFTDIEIANDEMGKPIVHTQGKVDEILRMNNIQSIHVSLSHLKNTAMAMVILER